MQTETDLAAAHAACERQDYAQALAILQSHLKYHRDDGRAWELYGLIFHSLGQSRQSVSALEQASLLVPLHSTARVSLAIGYGKIGRTQLSRDLLENLIHDRDVPVELLLQAASGLDAVGSPELAMQACRTAAQRDPSQPQPYYDLGYYSARCGRPPELTVSLARKAISLDPQNICYRVGLSSLLQNLSRHDEAYDVVRHFTSLQIDAIGCQCCLERIVKLFEDSRDFRGAVLCRRRLLELAGASADEIAAEEAN